jgi:hypothetical protein
MTKRNPEDRLLAKEKSGNPVHIGRVSMEATYLQSLARSRAEDVEQLRSSLMTRSTIDMIAEYGRGLWS